MSRVAAFLMAWLAYAGVAWAHPADVLIRSKDLEARLDPATGRFALSSRGHNRTFAREGKLRRDGGMPKTLDVRDPVFGNGRSIEVAYADGERESILLFDGVPFVLFRSAVRNATGAPVILNKVPGVSAALHVAPVEELRALGTGGLKPLDKNAGSYVWLAVADPKTHAGVVGGWLTHDRGSGVVFSSVEDGKPQLRAQLDYGRLNLAPGETAELETFALGYFDDARVGLEAWADAVARVYAIKLPPQPVGYCTWYHAGASREADIASDSAFAAKELAPYGFTFMQIDDGWQDGVKDNGPRKNFTRVRSNGPYPGGMQATAENIRSTGLTPGIWFMPFAGNFRDPWFADKQEWFFKGPDGRPFDTKWGGTGLDVTHPQAREYVVDVTRRIARDWGYKYLKMDGLFTGTGAKLVYVNDDYKDDAFGETTLHDARKTHVEAYRDGLKLVRHAAGREVFFLGCCIPQNMRSYGGAIGLVNAMRIGPDNNPKSWDGILRGPKYGSRHYFEHGRIWYDDPDPVYVRESLPIEQAKALASWVSLSGQLYVVSDALTKLPPERLEVLKRTMATHGAVARPVDLFDADIPRMWLVTDTRHGSRRDVIGLFNWEEKEATVESPLDRLGLEGKGPYVAFDYWENKLMRPLEGTLRATVPGRSCRVLAVRRAAEHPQLISTSRHVTQGMVDVLEEKWDAGASTLRGRSKVVGNDPYELRIVLPTGDKGWTAEAATISDADPAAGVKLSHKQEDRLVRVSVESPALREVSWAVRLRPTP